MFHWIHRRSVIFYLRVLHGCAIAATFVEIEAGTTLLHTSMRPVRNICVNGPQVIRSYS